MSRFNPGYLLLSLLALPLATPAAAQSEPEKGIYAVARGGGVFSPDQKFDLDKLPSSSTIQEKTKYKSGFTGEIGGGYDFGGFRVEQTIGYTSADLNRAKAETDGFTASGRSRSFYMTVSGYADIPINHMIVPYVGGGVGVARVDANLSRVDDSTSIGSSYQGKDWGLMMHGDLGVGVRVSPKTTLELGGRYTRISSLKFEGASAGIATDYKPTQSNISALLGVRHVF